mmetsp:Transcript_39287/g.128442  ORF Transcript_39287/g.128442 Transcript_39287/m.128442 type:complete len:131 (-) Transcript_39287:608-1000(-)
MGEALVRRLLEPVLADTLPAISDGVLINLFWISGFGFHQGAIPHLESALPLHSHQVSDCISCAVLNIESQLEVTWFGLNGHRALAVFHIPHLETLLWGKQSHNRAIKAVKPLPNGIDVATIVAKDRFFIR